ncbi:MAG: bifunctional 4-hydroxy-3-methylbut-2-enyl diphosphate reductase/30S ribosomal protein S1 [Clostridia bacterium]|nr:bifunctional 4-hydroxy-3-methylbut-2-enyl diphosphate reductase/30S ribosomal protein S1 [Clostridia bacterium]
MIVTVAKSTGFCFGVGNAVRKTQELAEKFNNVYCLGDLIHNDAVIRQLEKKGISFVQDISQVPDNSHLIIRAHGEPPETYRKSHERNLILHDLTCPDVRKIHRLVKEKYEQGYQIIIFGREDHPEVAGINGYCQNSAVIISDNEEAEKVVLDKKNNCLFSQTTMNKEKYDGIYQILKNKYPNVEKSDTICNATGIRQMQAVELAEKVDVMFIVGDKKSSNSKKLYELCKLACHKTYFIEHKGDIEPFMINDEKNIGIAAGASTPDWIVEEVKEAMEEKGKQGEKFDFEKAFEESLVTVRKGTLMTGKVISVNQKEVYVDLGFKIDGTIPAEEFEMDANGMPVVNVGDEVEALILNVKDSDGIVYLSKKRADEIKNREKINELSNSDEPIKVEVKEAVKGGLIVDVFGVEGFIPASQISDRFVRNLDKYVGRKIKVRIIENDKRKRKLILSRKVLIEEEKARIDKEVWGNMEVGKTVTGKVKSLTDFGAFVDLGGIDGLIHVTELSWGKISHPSDVLKKGQDVEVYIKDFNKEENKISLGYKKPEDNPWFNAEEKFETGRVFKGKIVRILPFGAFVNIQEGIDALVHISQISNRRITSPSQVLSEGMEVEFAIIDVDVEKQKINASIKAVKPYDPEIDEEEEKRIEEKKQKFKAKKEVVKPSNSYKEEMSNTIGDILAGLDISKEGNQTEEE